MAVAVSYSVMQQPVQPVPVMQQPLEPVVVQQPFEPKGVCVTVLSRAGPDAGPKVNSLHKAAETNDIESACLLLKAGKDVSEIKCVLL